MNEITFKVQDSNDKWGPFDYKLSVILNLLATGHNISLIQNGSATDFRSNFPEISKPSDFKILNWATYGLFTFGFIVATSFFNYLTFDRLIEISGFALFMSSLFYTSNAPLRYIFSTFYAIIFSWISYIAFWLIFALAMFMYAKFGPGLGAVIVGVLGIIALFAPYRISTIILNFRVTYLEVIIKKRIIND